MEFYSQLLSGTLKKYPFKGYHSDILEKGLIKQHNSRDNKCHIITYSLTVFIIKLYIINCNQWSRTCMYSERIILRMLNGNKNRCKEFPTLLR